MYHGNFLEETIYKSIYIKTKIVFCQKTSKYPRSSEQLKKESPQT